MFLCIEVSMQTVLKQVRPCHCFRVVIPLFWRCQKVTDWAVLA